MKKLLSHTCPHTRRRASCKYKGFTLAEILIASILIGLAVVSLVAAGRTFSQINGFAMQLTNAEFLIDQLQEMTATLEVVDPNTTTSTFGPEEASLADYDDLDDFDGIVFSPPINAARQQLADPVGFSQQVIVENVSASDFEQVVADHGSSFVRVTVRIMLNGKEVSSRQWLRARY